MPGVAMVVRMDAMAVTVIVGMVVRMPGHEPILPARMLELPSVVRSVPGIARLMRKLNFDPLCHDQENSN